MTLLEKFRSFLRQDRGAALVTVMLLISVMAAGAVMTFEALGYSVKRSTARKLFNQANYYALGGEQLAVAAAEKIRKAGARLTKPQAVSYPIEGGRIDGVISDISNCFNVNSLVERGDVGAYSERPEMVAQYQRLLGLLAFPDSEAQQLTAALVDWLDSDNRPVPFGAEDYDYGALAPAYRAANGLIADISELNSIRGYDAETIEVIMPHVCVGFDNSPGKLNVNTLKVEQAPLFASLIGGDFSVVTAADLIAARPARGYQDLADFWLERAFEGRTVDQNVRERTSIKPSLFRSRIRVRYHEAVSHLTSQIYVDADNRAQLIAHHFGVMQ